jgi:uncharacterized membrane protein
MKRFHLVLFSAVFGILVATWAMTAWFWHDLPSIIPIHFNFSGVPDSLAGKSLFYVFLIPLMQTAMFLIFTLIYRYPQYSSWPTTLILMAVEESKRNKIFEVIRSMLIAILIWISILFAYLQFTILATANGRAFGLAGYVMIGFLGLMLVYLVYYTAKMFFTIRKMVKTPKRLKG